MEGWRPPWLCYMVCGKPETSGQGQLKMFELTDVVTTSSTQSTDP